MDIPLVHSVVSFFGQLDWKSPYTYLGIFGAVGAPSTFLKALRWLKTVWHTSFVQFRHPSIHKDFYYGTRDFGYRVMEDGKTYLSLRRETVVSMLKSLDSVPVNYQWTGQGDITETLEPDNLEIVDRPKIIGKVNVRKSIKFETALAKREEFTYSILLICRVNERQPDSFLSSMSSRRVDRLILRVAFPVDKHPQHMTYRMLDSDGNEKSRTSLECSDHLTGEYRKEVRYPRPFFEHRIEWEE